MVFGEGGVVLAPPSLEPQAQTNLRWLKPPWENRPSQPTTLLKKFLTMIAPISESGPTVRAWEDIYPAVACHPPVLKALLAPAHSSTVYYQRLLETARRAGLQEASLLLGLLWHAPLGDAREQPQGLKNLQNLVEAAITPEDQDFWWEGEEKVRVPLPADQPEPVSSGASPGPLSSRPAAKEIQRLEPTAADPARYSPPAPPEGRPVSPDSPPWTVRDFTPGIQDMLRSYQDSLLVERQRYEAMIY
jgi:hypothetical protein